MSLSPTSLEIPAWQRRASASSLINIRLNLTEFSDINSHLGNLRLTFVITLHSWFKPECYGFCSPRSQPSSTPMGHFSAKCGQIFKNGDQLHKKISTEAFRNALHFRQLFKYFWFVFHCLKSKYHCHFIKQKKKTATLTVAFLHLSLHLRTEKEMQNNLWNPFKHFATWQ